MKYKQKLFFSRERKERVKKQYNILNRKVKRNMRL